jgi:hypothetical protein
MNKGKFYYQVEDDIFSRYLMSSASVISWNSFSKAVFKWVDEKNS